MEEYKRLVVLEGIDCSGKSMYAEMLTKRFNEKKFGNREWIHEHEPTFSSEQADRINFNKLNPWQREYYFMKDRINHQKTLRENNVVLDRYILSGLAYAQTFSPEVVPMMKSIYKMSDEFVHPDLTIFIDMDPMNAIAINESRKDKEDYNPKLTLDMLHKLRMGFMAHMQTMREMELPVYTVQPFFGDIDRTFESILNWIRRSPLI
jgi:thymidylate kinase